MSQKNCAWRLNHVVEFEKKMYLLPQKKEKKGRRYFQILCYCGSVCVKLLYPKETDDSKQEMRCGCMKYISMY